MRAVQEADKPSHIVGLGNYTLIMMVIGIIAIAVGDELAIADPGGATGLRRQPARLRRSGDLFACPVGVHARGDRPHAEVADPGLRGVVGPSPRHRTLQPRLAVTAASAVLVGVAVDDARAEPRSATPDVAAP